MVTGAAGCGSLGWVYPKLGIVPMSIQLPTYLRPKFLETKPEVETQATRFSGFLKLPGWLGEMRPNKPPSEAGKWARTPSSIPTRQLGSGGHCHPEHGTKTLLFGSTKTRDHQKNISKLVEQNQFLQLAAMLEARWLAWQVSNSFHLHLLWLSCCFLCRRQGDLCWTESSIERLIYLDQTCQVRFQTTSFTVCMDWHTSAPWQQHATTALPLMSSIGHGLHFAQAPQHGIFMVNIWLSLRVVVHHHVQDLWDTSIHYQLILLNVPRLMAAVPIKCGQLDF